MYSHYRIKVYVLLYFQDTYGTYLVFLTKTKQISIKIGINFTTLEIDDIMNVDYLMRFKLLQLH